MSTPHDFPLGNQLPDSHVTSITGHRDLDQRLWLRAKSMSQIIDVSRDTIERRGIPWQDHPVPHRLRYKLLRLSARVEPERRYYLPDLSTLLSDTPMRSTSVRMLPSLRSARG